MVDLVGFGVALATGIQFVEKFSDRCYRAALIPIMAEDNRAGKHEFVIGLIVDTYLVVLNTFQQSPSIPYILHAYFVFYNFL